MSNFKSAQFFKFVFVSVTIATLGFLGGCAFDGQKNASQCSVLASNNFHVDSKDSATLSVRLIERQCNTAENDLSGKNFNGCALQKANLSGKVLRGVKFIGAILYKADLSNSDLTGANFEGANMSHTRFEGSNLDSSNLRNAVLWGANLEDADLRCANLENTDLRAANVKNVKWDLALINNTVLDSTGSLDCNRLQNVNINSDSGNVAKYCNR